MLIGELDEAFSIQYSFVNIGSFIGTTFIAMLATTIVRYQDSSPVFLICGIFMFIDAAWFILKETLGDAGKKPFKVDQRKKCRYSR